MLACVGDVMPAGSAQDALHRASGGSLSRSLWPGFEDADAVLMNFEAPITDASQVHRNKRYSFKCTQKVLEFFDRRFVWGLANNHIFDYGERGLLDTIEALDARRLPRAGAGRNLNEARRPAILEHEGIGVGVLCAADPRYQSATNTSAGTFPADPGLLRESIRELRRSAQFAVVSIHSGQEFLPVPSPRQRQLAELCLEEGTSVVIFHHAHCISGVQADKRGVVFWGTGNYVFPRGDTPKQYSAWQNSAVWRVTLNPLRRDVERIAIHPVILDRDGLPGEPSETRAQETLDRIALYSECLSRPGRLRWWRLREMMSPIYLWMNLVNYVDIARRNGVRACLRTLAEGMSAQLTAGPSDRLKQ
ncbi:MAG TPA: CapA family protein [Acidobacteriota bacterium]|nr:CapA family protein [Acidobacteriota bacterium]